VVFSHPAIRSCVSCAHPSARHEQFLCRTVTTLGIYRRLSLIRSMLLIPVPADVSAQKGVMVPGGVSGFGNQHRRRAMGFKPSVKTALNLTFWWVSERSFHPFSHLGILFGTGRHASLPPGLRRGWSRTGKNCQKVRTSTFINFIPVLFTPLYHTRVYMYPSLPCPVPWWVYPSLPTRYHGGCAIPPCAPWGGVLYFPVHHGVYTLPASHGGYTPFLPPMVGIVPYPRHPGGYSTVP